MDTVDVVIMGSVFLMFSGIGLAVYYLFFYAQEGEKCEIDEDDADEFGIYTYDDKKECVLTDCNTGYKLVGDKCVKENCKTGYKLVGDKCVEKDKIKTCLYTYEDVCNKPNQSKKYKSTRVFYPSVNDKTCSDVESKENKPEDTEGTRICVPTS